MTSPWRSKSFLDLKREWDKKLKDDNFKDVESFDPRSNETRLKEWDSFYFQTHSDPELFHLKQEYYYRAHQFLNAHTFKCQRDKDIWRLHSEGTGVRGIARHFVDEGQKSNKDFVAAIVNSLKAEMKGFFTECKETISSSLDQQQSSIFPSSTALGSKACVPRTPGLRESKKRPISQIIDQLSLEF